MCYSGASRCATRAENSSARDLRNLDVANTRLYVIYCISHGLLRNNRLDAQTFCRSFIRIFTTVERFEAQSDRQLVVDCGGVRVTDPGAVAQIRHNVDNLVFFACSSSNKVSFPSYGVQ